MLRMGRLAVRLSVSTQRDGEIYREIHLTTEHTDTKTLIEEETEHRQKVRQVVFGIMHETIFLDTREKTTAEIQTAVRGFASLVYGPDVARIAADRVIDCLMWL